MPDNDGMMRARQGRPNDGQSVVDGTTVAQCDDGRELWMTVAMVMMMTDDGLWWDSWLVMGGLGVMGWCCACAQEQYGFDLVSV